MNERSAEHRSQRVVRLYYGFQLFFSLLVWLPIYYEYQKHFGLSPAEIFSIQSLYYIAFCLLEIPTGLIADLWGHRRCMRIGAAVLAASQLLPIFMPTFFGFLMHFMAIALSRSLISGASSAYLYEHLKLLGDQDRFRTIEGRSRAYGLVAKVVAWGAVGSLMTWHITLPYWFTFVAALISVVYAWLLPVLPTTIIQTKASLQTFGVVLSRLTETGKQLKSSPYMMLLILQGIAIFVLSRIVQVNLFQPILVSKDIQLSYHGMIMAAMTIFEALGSAYPNMLLRLLNGKNSVFALTALLGAALIGLTFSGPILAIVILCLFALWSGLAYPIQRQLFNDAIPDSSYRATMMSMESIVDRAACAWVATLLGAVMMKPSGLNDFMMLSGIVTLVTVLGLVLIFKKILK